MGSKNLNEKIMECISNPAKEPFDDRNHAAGESDRKVSG